MIERVLQKAIKERLFKGKALLLFGARQTGKSTLAIEMLEKQDKPWMVMNGDDADVREVLSSTSAGKLKALIGKNEILLIDEAQRIENIGLTIKIITDQIKNVQVIATGSSSFELSGKVNEPLTGRKYEFMLFPLSFQEMVQHHGLLEEKRQLEQRIIFGYYPEIVTHPGEEKERLQLLTDSYLYKDLLMLEQIKKPALLEKLLKALALQIGSEVKFNEVAQTIGSDQKTVEKYIDLLQKAFVLFQVPAFSRNVRNEIKKGRKIYFYDCGVRNAVLNNFNTLSNRTDTGALWENFVMAERLKYLRYKSDDAKFYFWRTTQQQEIDLVEEAGDKLTAYEIKWKKTKIRLPVTFTANYPNVPSAVISQENVEEFIGGV
jgi:uncharacterized protein